MRASGAPRGAVALLLALLSGASAAPAGGAGSAETVLGGRISGDVRVSGRIRVTGDVAIVRGGRLTVAPGSVVVCDRSESTKVEPEFLYGGPEIVVRGELRAEKTEFRFPERTGGIVVAGGGSALLADCGISGAEAGLAVLRGGGIAVRGTLVIRDCRVGAAFFPGGRLDRGGAGTVRLEGNGVGVVRFGPFPEPLEGMAFAGNQEAAVVSWSGSAAPAAPDVGIPSPGRSAARIGDAFVEQNRTISGDVIVDGIVRVAPGATLTIEPGSRLFFAFRDTDGDGIGENGIFVQGTLRCVGTKERRIGFYPLEGSAAGRWDSVNFMASDAGGNVLEHVDIAGAYRGLHAHFSRLSAKDVRIARCFRGIQFQESDVTMSGLAVDDSWSAIRFRDSNVRIDGLSIRDTVSGMNVLRSVVRIDLASMERPGWYGLRLRESRAEVGRGSVSGAFVAYSVQEGRAEFADLSAREAGLAGFALFDADVKMTGCRAAGSRVDGLSATRGRATLSGGALRENARYAVKVEGAADVTLTGVDLGAAGTRGSAPIFDGKVRAGLGIVKVE